MTPPPTSILERRRDQMSPELDPLEIERMRRFGETRNFAKSDVILTAGQVGPGFVVILSGEIDIVRRESSREGIIVTHGPGQFMGELAQLAGRPALADAIAKKPVAVFRWPPACSVGFIGDAGQARRPPVVCSTADPLVCYLDVYPRAVGQYLQAALDESCQRSQSKGLSPHSARP
jgi:hypothetical protein